MSIARRCSQAWLRLRPTPVQRSLCRPPVVLLPHARARQLPLFPAHGLCYSSRPYHSHTPLRPHRFVYSCPPVNTAPRRCAVPTPSSPLCTPLRSAAHPALESSAYLFYCIKPFRTPTPAPLPTSHLPPPIAYTIDCWTARHHRPVFSIVARSPCRLYSSADVGITRTIRFHRGECLWTDSREGTLS